MRLRLLIFLLTIMFPLFTKGQNDHIKYKIDSLTSELKKATDPDSKFGLYKALSNLEEEKKKHKSELLLNSELSGNTDLQLRTYLLVAQLAGNDSAQFYLDKMFALAKEKKNEEYQGWYYLNSGFEQFFSP